MTDMNRLYVITNLNEQKEFDMRLPTGRFLFKVNQSVDGKFVENEIANPLIINGEDELRFDIMFDQVI